MTEYPFAGWTHGGTTHFEGCWKGHMSCALILAKGIIATLLDVGEYPPTDEEQEFIDIISREEERR